ncbi:MAG: tRNA (adenosine(37)-N6)-dimethylallyltransferase MiaA [Acidimicrobiales bacterium]
MSAGRVPAVVLVGPTASGKSSLAHAAARQHGGVEIVTIDSMQVYRGMDIGTAKPTTAEQSVVAYHLIDLIEPHETYTVSCFQDDAAVALDAIADRGHVALGVGGTALYLRALVDALDIPGQFPEARAAIEVEPDTEALHRQLAALDPTAAARMEPSNRRRIVRALEVTIGSGRPFSDYGPGLEHHAETPARLIGLRWPRDLLDRRIADRYAAMMDAGLLAEVERLLATASGVSATARQALGYRELLSHLEDGVPLDEAVATAVRRTRRFARRQERWFRRDPRIEWWDLATDEDLDAAADRLQSVLADDRP